MKKYLWILPIFLLSLVSFNPNVAIADSTPVITSISPASINYDDTVDILGSGFGDKTVSNGHTDDGSAVIVAGTGQGQVLISWSDTDIKVSVNNTPYAPGTYNLEVDAVQGSKRVYSNSYPVTINNLLPECTPSSWTYSDWSPCSADGTQTRSVTSTVQQCSGGSHAITQQSCTLSLSVPSTPSTPQIIQPLLPICSSDTWSCGNWGSCSPDGLQKRSCVKTFSCSNAATPPPDTEQYCTSQNPSPQSPQNTEQNGINFNQIFKATVELKCPWSDGKHGYQGSGTVIDEYGSILTNRHMVLGTIGQCTVGFINSENDVPSFTAIADVKKIGWDPGENGDMALLKIRNDNNQKFTAVDIFQGDSQNLQASDTISTFGYPDSDYYGQTVTTTEGSYGGIGTTLKVCGNTLDVSGFFKTTASIYHGNSGGGAYQKSTGYFMGMPTLGTSCDPKVPSQINYVLSVNTIRHWLSSFGSYNVNQDNYSNLGNYFSSSVKIENIDMSKLQAIDAPASQVITSNKGVKVSGVISAPSPTANQPVALSTTPNQVIQESIPPATQPQSKASLFHKFINWLFGLWKKIL